MKDKFQIEAYATSANLGPGFDALGLCLNAKNKIIVQRTDMHMEEENLFTKAYQKVFAEAKEKVIPVSLEQKMEIPICRGLGSSAAIIAAGLVAGNYVLGSPFSKEELLLMGTEIEGHPDNIVPAFLGGFTVSVFQKEAKQLHYIRQELSEQLTFCVLIPEFSLATQKAREILPTMIPRQDGVFNVSRSSFLTAAMLRGDLELLKYALEDRLHEAYREDLIPGFSFLRQKVADLDIIGSALSGAGPSMLLFVDNQKEKVESIKRDVLPLLQEATERSGVLWNYRFMSGCNEGISIAGEENYLA